MAKTAKPKVLKPDFDVISADGRRPRQLTYVSCTECRVLRMFHLNYTFAQVEETEQQGSEHWAWRKAIVFRDLGLMGHAVRGKGRAHTVNTDPRLLLVRANRPERKGYVAGLQYRCAGGTLYSEVFAPHTTTGGFDEEKPLRAEWLTDTVRTLATQMRDTDEFSALPILADALQDAGCDDEQILTGCREIVVPAVAPHPVGAPVTNPNYWQELDRRTLNVFERRWLTWRQRRIVERLVGWPSREVWEKLDRKPGAD